MEDLPETDVVEDVFICISEKIYPTDCSQAQKRIIHKKTKRLKFMMVNCYLHEVKERSVVETVRHSII